jgi:hypothetical protein
MPRMALSRSVWACRGQGRVPGASLCASRDRGPHKDPTLLRAWRANTANPDTPKGYARGTPRQLADLHR